MPAFNRLLMFDGSMLHGVVPGVSTVTRAGCDLALGKYQVVRFQNGKLKTATAFDEYH